MPDTVTISEKEYCSEICGAKCCRSEWILRKPCPKLGPDNLCTIYEDRLSQRHTNRTHDGTRVTCVCLPIQEGFQHMPRHVVEQCCHHDPSLLEQPADWREKLKQSNQ